jgi:hypothetical protein
MKSTPDYQMIGIAVLAGIGVAYLFLTGTFL